MTDWRSDIAARGLAAPADIQGISLEQLHEIETSYGVSLPAAYREFMLDCGLKAGSLGRTIDLLFPGPLLLLRAWRRVVTEEQLDLPLPANCLFISAYNLEFDCLICDGRPDPQVYRCSPELPFSFEPLDKSLTEFLSALLATAHPYVPTPPAYHIGPQGEVIAGIVDAEGQLIPGS